MKSIKPRILFFGELPNGSVHGISNANKINIRILESEFSIDIVADTVRMEEHDKVTLSKITNFLKNNFKVIIKSVLNRYKYFYLVYSLSLFGSVKCLSVILMFRIFNNGEVILHIHRGDFFTRFYTNKLNKLITKLVFSHSDKIIVLSDKQKKEFETVFRGSFHVLRNTIENKSQVNSFTRGANRFIFISNYLIDKGILDLLEVFSKLKDKYDSITLETYGEFSDRKLKETIYSYNSSRIHINGPVSGGTKYVAISESDCLILPSWNEGQPIILIEAMSVGTPVIASAVGLIPELLGEDYPFMAVPGDKISLKEKIIQFIEYPNKAAISEQLNNHYRNFYAHEEHSRELMTIFN